jgi:hypothetical protein
VTTAKNGLSAKTLERTLGIRYRVAWAMVQRFRVAMVRSERDRLAGAVEVDETLVGGVRHGGTRRRGREGRAKALSRPRKFTDRLLGALTRRFVQTVLSFYAERMKKGGAAGESRKCKPGTLRKSHSKRAPQTNVFGAIRRDCNQ